MPASNAQSNCNDLCLQLSLMKRKNNYKHKKYCGPHENDKHVDRKNKSSLDEGLWPNRKYRGTVLTPQV